MFIVDDDNVVVFSRSSSAWSVSGGSNPDCESCGLLSPPGDCSKCPDPLLKSFTEPSLHLQSNSALSFMKRFRGKASDGTTSVTFPHLTAVIAVDNGDITGITWDDGCYFCLEDTCEENSYKLSAELNPSGGKSCYVNDAECLNAEGLVSEQCALSVYVVWTGTDSEGKSLKSAQMRFSQFLSFSLTQYATTVKGTFEKAYSASQDAVDVPDA